MESPSYITTKIQALVGQEATFQTTEPVDAGKIRRFARALALDNPSYYDLTNGQPIAPLTFVFTVNHDSMAALDESGRPTHRLSLPPPFGPAIRGGNKFQFFRPVRVGDLIFIYRKITDLRERQGRQGPLAFLTYDLKYTSQNGDLLGINTETLIFKITQDRPESKEADEKDGNKPVFKIRSGQEIPSFQITVSKIQMMMYAAAIWNPFQLHWDSDYSRKLGFPDAIIPGPMFGAYIVEMLVRWAGSPFKIKSIEYKNRAIAIPGDTLICRGKTLTQYKEADRCYWDCQVWIENQNGLVLAEGQAAVCLV
jgi:hydroxyacyl-ACP dehydratase HTD2-like protein with hotdog domain